MTHLTKSSKYHDSNFAKIVFAVTLLPVIQSGHNFPHDNCHDSWLVSGPDDSESGGRLNKKDGLTRYGDSHVKDKTS